VVPGTQEGNPEPSGEGFGGKNEKGRISISLAILNFARFKQKSLYPIFVVLIWSTLGEI
jgi:hypothetical protein